MILHDDVGEALAAGRPVVALESTIIAHGLPRPQNLHMAQEVEQIVRDAGAVPATIAVLGGRLHVGLTPAELERLAQSDDVLKLSSADLAFALVRGRSGATTVAATMIAARLAGIDVFATGGIGGVHPGAETSFDISADLEELARTPVIVVCAGAKAVLDLPKTWEFLETKGVPVVTYGADFLPAFWSARSPHKTPLRLDRAEDIARFHQVRQQLDLPGGVVVANPPPDDAEIPFERMQVHIEAALEAARAAKISGKAVTPYLLGKISQSTAGQSVAANIALVKSNAQLAARISHALSTGPGG